MSSYKFKRDDTGEVIEVSFTEMMEARDGFLQLKDGTLARRVSRPTETAKTKPVAERKKIISDAMGFGKHQFAEMEADRKGNGFNDIEFVPDPAVPEFYQVHCGSEQAKRRYMDHRSFTDRNSRNGSGAMLTEKDFADAEELAKR